MALAIALAQLPVALTDPAGYFAAPNIDGLRALSLYLIDSLLLACLLIPLMVALFAGMLSLRRPDYAILPIAAILYPLLLLGAASWTMHRGAGAFLNMEGLRFFQVNFRQVISHAVLIQGARFYTAAIGLFAVLLIALVGLLTAMRRLERWRRPGIALGVLALWPALALVAAIAWWGAPGESAPAANAHLRSGTGPLSAMLIDLASKPAAMDREQEVEPLPLERHPPIISGEEYRRRIDPTTVVRANVLILLVESMRPDALARGGAKREIMPRLDRLADSGLWFERAWAHSTHSDYADLCPIASQYPLRSSRHYYYPKNIDYPRVPIYDVLQPLGWKTAIFSAQNEGWGNMRNYLETGNLDVFFDAESAEWGHYDVLDAPEFTARYPSGKLDDRAPVDAALRWTAGLGDNQPFFIYMNLQRSHYPYTWPDDFAAPFAPYALDFPRTFFDYPRDKIDLMRNRYDNSLRYIDTQIGRLLDGWARQGKLEDTLIVVTSDNGQAFYEHGFPTHSGPLYEELWRVPLLMAWGTRWMGKTILRPTEHVDVPPTVLGLLGLPPHPGMQGNDAFAAPGAPNLIYGVAHTPLATQVGVIDWPWKYIEDRRRRSRMLFNLEADPAEKINRLVGQRETAERLARRVHRWRATQLHYYRTPELHTRRYPPVYP